MQLSHKIQLKPNNSQISHLLKCCGVARFCYNWGLAEWNKQYKDGKKPSSYELKKQLNSVKKEQFPWIYEVGKSCVETGFMRLNSAFSNFFRGCKTGEKIGYPRFKKKNKSKDSFTISHFYFRIDGKFIRIQRLGWVGMVEELRFIGKLQSVTVSRTADKWFVSISVDIPDGEVSENQVHSSIGIDLGIKTLATLSTSEQFKNARIYNRFQRRLQSANKSLARKVHGSNNWKKQKVRLQRLHYKIACCRSNRTHQITSAITNQFSDICIEDLNVKGMVRNSRLSKALQDVSFGEFRRQLEYKAIRVHTVSTWFPSSKTCSKCGFINEDLQLSDRSWICSNCGTVLDRDINAAINILRQGMSCMPVETEALAEIHLSETTVNEAGSIH